MADAMRGTAKALGHQRVRVMEVFVEEVPFELSFKRWLDVNCISIKFVKNTNKNKRWLGNK